MTAAVIYAAKSTQDRKGSIPEQVADARTMCDDNGWDVVGEYTDEGFSAYSGNRGPGLADAQQHAAKAAAESGEVCMLVAQAHDRFARGAGDKPGAPESLGEIWHRCRRLNVELRTAEDDEELRDEASVAAIGRRAYIDSRRKSKSVRKGLARQVDRPHGPPGYGFRRRDDDGHWEADSDEAPIVRRMLATYLGTAAFNATAAALNRDGVRPRRSATWTAGMVRKVITGRAIIGEFWRAGEWHDGQHDAIVAVDDWTAAQLLAEQARKYSPKGGGRLPARHVFVRGMLRCAVCGAGGNEGAAMIPRTDSRRKTASERYVCAEHLRDKDACPVPPLPRELIERSVLAMFERDALSVEKTREHVAAQLERTASEAGALIAASERAIATAQAALVKFDRDYASGDLTAAHYERLMADYTDQLQAEQAKRDRLTDHAEQAVLASDSLDVESETLRRLVDLRQAIAGHVNQAGNDVGALRAAMASVFVRLWVAFDTNRECFVVVPEFRHEMVTGLHRVPILFDAINQHDTFVS